MLRSLKGQRTRLHKKIEEELSNARRLNATNAAETGENLRARVEVSLAVLNKFQERFDSLTAQILQNSEGRSDEDLDRDDEFVVDVTSDIAHSSAELSTFLSRLDRRESVGSGAADVSSGLESIQQKIDKLVELQGLQLSVPDLSSTGLSEASPGRSTHFTRLPKIEFDKFSGDILKFQEFWDSFEAAVHSNSCLRPVEKLNYLRTYLAGDAKQVISGVATCDANYEVAVELVKKRFGNLQASIDAHYGRLTNLLSAPNYTPKLRSLLDEIEKHLRCLSALGEDVEHRHFISLIMSKLPREVVIRLEESKDDEEVWTVELLRKKIQSQLSAREAAERQHSSASPPGPEKHGSSVDRSFVSTRRPPFSRRWGGSKSTSHTTTESLVAGEKSFRTGSAEKCAMCNGDHYSDQCHRFKSVDERRRRLRGRCFICLKKDHIAPNCHSTKPCFHCKEVKKHHRCMCPAKFSISSEASAITVDDSSSSSASAAGSAAPHHAVLASGDRVLLQTATVEVMNHSGLRTATTRALLDCASNRSYISSSLAAKLQLQSSGIEYFSVVTFGSEKPKTVETTTATIKLLLKDGTSKTFDVNVVQKITGTIHRAPVNFEASNFLWKNLPLADTLPSAKECSPVDFLIGNDYYLDLITAQKIEVSPGLYLLGSKLGWLLTGRIDNEKSSAPSMSLFVSSCVNSSVPQLSTFSGVDSSLPLKPSFEDFWSLESIGIKDSPEMNDDDKALSAFNSTVKLDDGRYQVTWPWKESSVDLPENYQLALGRFKSLVRKFQADPSLFSKYGDIIRDQEDKGIIEKVTSCSEEGMYKHYIPHHPVINPLKPTTKVRIVYDASAKVRKGSKSLNECLLRGPVILEDLCGLLLRFRLVNVVVISDIEKAFLQIGLQTADRDVTRFFWLKDPKTPAVESNLQVYRFCRVPFGVISSPFLLGATVKYHLKNEGSSVAERISDNVYVDNVITGVNSPEEAVEFYKKAKSIFATASMNLREWASNSSEFLAKVPEYDKVRSSIVKVLGVTWDSNEDTLCVTGNTADSLFSASTKRQVFQSLASVFDPLGFFIPLTVKAKLFIHQLWAEKLDWDDPIDEKHIEEWNLIAAELAKISSMKIPRFVGVQSESPEEIQLFCFCDASAVAYSAVVYMKTGSKKSSVSLVFAKSRLAPSKSITIPRLELLAVLIGVRCLKFVEKQLRMVVKKKMLWTDSQCVLHWLSSKKPLTVFVENRINEVRQHSDVSFKYVNTQQNPADIPTRGQYSFEEMNSSNWWSGPTWLTKGEDQWPSWPYDVPEDSCITEDVCPRDAHETSLVSVPYVHNLPPFGIDIDRFSSLVKLYRVTAWIHRFIDKLRKKTHNSGTLATSEISEAKDSWDRYIQASSFAEVQHAIGSDKKCNLKEQLNVQRDDAGILRCHGRFAYADIPDSSKFPKLLPNRGPYTDLVIRHYHERLLHSGVNHTLSQIRLEYWIPQGRSTVRRFIARCIRCRRLDGGPYRVPPMPPWPVSRVSPSTPFSYVGLDYLGPLHVKSKPCEFQKVWICLFTCLAVRAVHLEVVEDMSAEQFLLCFRRFMARRGKPIQIISDNATQFKLSKKVLERCWGDVLSAPEVKNYVSSQGISWKFIIERAPWMGGFYERLVGSVKRALKKGVARLCLSPIQLTTSVAEVEAVLNTRPLFYVGEDFEGGRSITPNDFLSLNPQPGIPPLKSDVTSDDPSFLPKPDSVDGLIYSWKKGHQMLDKFWQHWREDYLSSLRERSDFQHKQGRVLSVSPPLIDALVLIKDDNLPRGAWKVGKIQHLIRSQDGEVRAAQVKTPSGKVLNRPLKLLYPLEIQSESKERSHDSQVKSIATPQGKDTKQGSIANSPAAKVSSKYHGKVTAKADASKIPKRAASIKAKQRIKECLLEEKEQED